MGQKKIENNEYKRTIAVVRFSAIGDVVMSIPVVYSAARLNPDVKFVFATRPAMARLFVNAPVNLEVIGYDLEDSKWEGVKGFLSIFKDLKRRFSPDTIVDLHGVLRSRAIGLLGRLNGLKTLTIDKGKDEKSKLTRPHDKEMIKLKSTIQRYADTFEKAGIKSDDSFKGLYDANSVVDLTAGGRVVRQPGEHLIGIAPFAKHKGKIYPIHLMQKVVERLVADKSNRIVLFGGGGDEAAVLNRWAEKYDRVVSLAGCRLGFDVELQLMSGLDCMIAMDSANMHLASLVNTPVVSIWGATHPFVGFRPWGQPDDLMIQEEDLCCRPCSVFGDKECGYGDYRCMTMIDPQRIVDKVNEVIQKYS
ncbi:MAG: glycosyltransferase family 9 protein [Muribaculaceae bacterium]|nr:glycosyltransferase family 9 protein [Muribaculaceae bacterium]